MKSGGCWNIIASFVFLGGECMRPHIFAAVSVPNHSTPTWVVKRAHAMQSAASPSTINPNHIHGYDIITPCIAIAITQLQQAKVRPRPLVHSLLLFFGLFVAGKLE